MSRVTRKQKARSDSALAWRKKAYKDRCFVRRSVLKKVAYQCGHVYGAEPTITFFGREVKFSQEYRELCPHCFLKKAASVFRRCGMCGIGILPGDAAYAKDESVVTSIRYRSWWWRIDIGYVRGILVCGQCQPRTGLKLSKDGKMLEE